MKFNNNRVGKIFFTATALMLIVFVSLSLSLFSGINFAFAAVDKSLEITRTGMMQESIMDKAFADDSVIVVLRPQISEVNKTHDAKWFKGIEIESITDLTRRKYNLESKNADFKQILQIHLKEKGEENVIKAIECLKKLDGVLAAEPNYFSCTTVNPNDPHYANGTLWGLNGTNGIKAPDAWNLTRGSNAVRVGIIDTGIANHEDLNANLTVGIDTFNNDNVTNDDTSSHGTHVAGIVGAVGNNSVGVTGVNWNVSLVPLQASNANNRFATADVIEAIEWAQDRWGSNEQVSILNYSVSGFGVNTAVREAVSQYDGLFVWAAGNQAENIDNRINANGSFNLDNIISVGAINSNGTRRASSNYSANNTNVHIYAPGTDIYSTVPVDLDSSGYANKSGTSMAAPHVAGVAALMLSANPNMTGGVGEKLGARLKHALINNADIVSITIPNGSGGTVSQNVRKLNSFTAVSAAAFTTGTATGGISISGFSAGYIMPNNTNLSLPGNFAPLGTTSRQTVLEIDFSAFANQTKLAKISLPSSVTKIGSSAFENCSGLTRITYSGVNEIHESAFRGCGKLATPGLTYSLSSNGAYYTVTGGNLDSTNTLFIPSTYNGKPVRQIKAEAFKQKNSLRWLFTQSGLTTIGNRAFQFCSNLRSVDLYQTSVTRIEAYTFDTCQLGKFYFPSNLTYVGEGAFIRAGRLTSSLPDSVTYIGNYAFAYRQEYDLAGIRLPNNLYEIGNYAFAGCGDYIVTNIDGTGLQKIGNYAFYNTKLYNLTIPSTVTNIGKGAFKNSNIPAGFTFKDGTQLQSIGEEGFANNEIEKLVLPASLTAIGKNAFSGNSNLIIYTGQSSKPSGWDNAWNSSNRPVVWGCTLSSSGYVVSFVKSTTNPTYSNGNNINNPKRTSYNFAGWYVASDYSGDCYWDIKTAPNGRLYAKWVTPPPPSCIAEGTLVTLADGSQVAVEDLTGDENLLVWNMLTGQFDSAPILFIDSDPYTEYEIIHLHFSDGTEVKVIYEHAFWDFNLNRYVFMRNDAAQYIGHWFNKQTEDADGNMIWTQVQLVDVDIYNEYTTAWSPVTYSHFCLYVNGMLSMPGATEGLINIFEVDSTTMQYDMDAYYADIEEYGLFTYEEFNELIPVPEVIFDAFNGQYLKVSIGKGLITIEELRELVEYYAPLFPVEDVEPDNETEEDITVEEIVEEILDTVIGFFEELMNYFGWAGIFAI